MDYQNIEKFVKIFSLSRGTSLYSSARNSPYMGRETGLRRAQTAPRAPLVANRLNISAAGRNHHIKMKDASLPLIQVDQV